MYNNTRMSRGVHRAGNITVAGATVIDMGEAPLPSTVTLKSADASRLIELSTDGGIEYFTPAIDQTSATMRVLTITSSVSHVRITGIVFDTWSIR
jgi:hypothetical protein